jgi:hypothetical protein
MKPATLCDPAEHRPGHQAGAAGVVEIEEPADQLARGEQAGDRRAVGADHRRSVVDLQAAEGEGDAAGHGIGLERRRSIVLAQLDFGTARPAVPAAVLDVRIERVPRS